MTGRVASLAAALRCGFPALERKRVPRQWEADGEEYERDVMYAEFIKEAEAAGQKDAVRTFTLASKAENVHAQLYGEALANLEAQRVKTTFYVCLHCGEVSDKPEVTESCPICGAKVEMFEKVR